MECGCRSHRSRRCGSEVWGSQANRTIAHGERPAPHPLDHHGPLPLHRRTRAPSGWPTHPLAQYAIESKLYLYALLLITPTYYALRIPSLWSGQNLVSFIEDYLSPEHSMGFRFACERVLVDKATRQPAWGSGGWGGNRVIGPDGKDLAPTDGCGSSVSGVTDSLVCRPGRP